MSVRSPCSRFKDSVSHSNFLFLFFFISFLVRRVILDLLAPPAEIRPPLLCPSDPPPLQVVNRWPPCAGREADDSGFGPSRREDGQVSVRQSCSLPDVFLALPQTSNSLPKYINESRPLSKFFRSRSLFTTNASDVFSLA